MGNLKSVMLIGKLSMGSVIVFPAKINGDGAGGDAR
jgi:hypothetical protein